MVKQMAPGKLLLSNSVRHDYRVQGRFAEHKIRALLANHHGRRIQIGRQHARHDRGIDNPQPLHAMHPEPIIDHRRRVGSRPHTACAHDVIRRAAPVARCIEQFVIALRLRARILFAIIVR